AIRTARAAGRTAGAAYSGGGLRVDQKESHRAAIRATATPQPRPKTLPLPKAPRRDRRRLRGAWARGSRATSPVHALRRERTAEDRKETRRRCKAAAAAPSEVWLLLRGRRNTFAAVPIAGRQPARESDSYKDSARHSRENTQHV